MNKQEEIKTQRELLNKFIKQVVTRIKEVQQEQKDCFSQEDVWIKQGIEHELINWKISLEKWRKKLMYESNAIFAEGINTSYHIDLIQRDMMETNHAVNSGSLSKEEFEIKYSKFKK